MRSEHEPPIEQPFWQIDVALGALELVEPPNGSDTYTVQLKAHTTTAPYHPHHELYPLQHAGSQHEVCGKAYILVPDVTVTAGLFKGTTPSGAIGTVLDSAWQGMRHHDLASVRGLYYEEDRALAIWEVDAWRRLDEFAHGQLWQLFEGFLVTRFPNARQLFTDDTEPYENIKRNREFLQALVIGQSTKPGKSVSKRRADTMYTHMADPSSKPLKHRSRQVNIRVLPSQVIVPSSCR